MLKRIFALGVCLLLCLTAIPIAHGVETSAKSVLLMERETGTVLYEENADNQLEPASVTKVMTMLLVAEAIEGGILSLDQSITVSDRAAGMGGSQVYLKEGEQMTVHDLLKAVAVASGNDAAVALAESIAGSEDAFVERMNQRAVQLGMKNTHFCNCTGLPAEGHLTTARDIALMSRELLSHDLIRDYTGIWMDSLRGGEFQLANTNKLIYYYDGATGLKTGSTDGAGYCISASALRNGMELIAVVLGSETSAQRFDTAKALLDYGFGCYTLARLSPQLPTVPVVLGEQDEVSAALTGEIVLVVEKGQESALTTEVTLPEQVDAPVAVGDPLGTLAVMLEGKTVAEYPLAAGEDVARLTLGGIFRQFWGRMSMAWAG